VSESGFGEGKRGDNMGFSNIFNSITTKLIKLTFVSFVF
jgi:hypothetical protein